MWRWGDGLYVLSACAMHMAKRATVYIVGCFMCFLCISVCVCVCVCLQPIILYL